MSGHAAKNVHECQFGQEDFEELRVEQGSLRGYSQAMNKLIRVVLSVIAGLVIGVVIAAVVNLMKPAPEILWALIPLCLSSVASALVGFAFGARQKVKPPAAK
jgi:hypothetical protein